jgi:hypothetical protein
LGAVGCLNPVLVSQVEVDVNHAPVIASAQPLPDVAPVSIELGRSLAENCRPVSFRLDTLQDADLDRLTVRFFLLIERDDVVRAREEIFGASLDPLDTPAPDGGRYPPVVLDVSRALIQGNLGRVETDAQTAGKTQLLEVRVSDRGFVEGTVADVPDGAGLAFLSWQVQLTADGCTP